MRIGLMEITPRLFSNYEIDTWINEGARIMCSEAKTLTNYFQRLTVLNRQEYELPDDVDEIFGVWFQNGQPLQQRPIQEKKGFQGSGVPMQYYIRKGALIFAGQTNAPSNDIVLSDIPQPTTGRKPKMIIGLYPIPAQSANLTIGYYARHYYMNVDNDEPAIDEEYQRGIIAYATAQGKRKQSAMPEHDKEMATFNDFKARNNEKAMNNGQLMEFPRMKIRGRNQDDYGGTSWLYVGDAT